MKAAVFYGKEDLRIEELPMPEVGPQDVLIKVCACGICGTDMHIFDGDKGAADTPSGTVLGHEFAGVVEKTGSEVTGVSVGDSVSVDPNQLCGRCDFCRSGIGHFCTQMIGIGTTVNGGFAQYCSVNQSQVYQLPKGISFSQGAMNEPLACCLHGIDLCEIKPGTDAVVIGAGMIGQIMLQLAKQSGATNVIVIEPLAEKRMQAERLGAVLTIDPTEQDARAVLVKNGYDNIETVIECVGKSQTVEQAIVLAGNKSMVMLFGLTKPDDTAMIRPFEIFQKEITIRASFINPYTQKRALKLIGSGSVNVTDMMLPAEPLSALPDILADKRKRAAGKYVIDPWL